MINCPKCSSELLVETPALGNIPLDVCPACSGIWFDRDELEALLKQSQGANAADLELINSRDGGLECPRCSKKMARGGLVNPLLLVDRCRSCGGIWLDSHELDLAGKLLGLSNGPAEVKVDRPAPATAAPPEWDGAPVRTKSVPAVCAILGFIGLSYEMYLYFAPAEAVSHAPSAAMTFVGILLFAGGIFFLSRGK